MKNCGVPPLPEQRDARCSHLRRRWYWGSQGFAETLQAMHGKMLKAAKRPKSRGYQRTPQGEWIAEKLQMRSATNVSQQIRRLDKRRSPPNLPLALQRFLESLESS